LQVCGLRLGSLLLLVVWKLSAEHLLLLRQMRQQHYYC
jgi:hypothetical protein